ncbi:MAG: teichuronic acid exporter [Chloroflexota bacterium]|nr:teichuronic acid exporter [Chloroflexota bacterium]
MEDNTHSSFAKVTIRGTFWSYLSVYTGKFMVFISTIILARLLSKSDFGVVGYAFIVTSFLDALNGLGIGPALIYHEDEPETADTAFWLGLAVGLGLFILTWIAAPFIGDYFHDDRAVGVVRMMVLVYPISAFGNVNSIYLAKRLDFRKKFVPEVSYALTKGVVSVVTAFLGFGYWSQVWGQVVANGVSVVVAKVVNPWKPSWRFSRPIAKSMLKYGLNIVVLDTLANLLNNADYLFIGRYLGAEALGVYTLGFRIPDMVLTQFARIVSEVIFPVYVKMRDNVETLNRNFARSLQYVSLITIPLGLGIALTAEPFVMTFFTDKWVEAIPVIRAIAVYALLLSLFRNAGSFYKAQGRPEVLTYLAIVRLAILLPGLWFALARYNSIVAVAWVQAIVALISGVLSLAVAARMFHMSTREILVQFVPGTVSGLLMAAAVAGLLHWIAAWPPLVQLILAVLIGALVYVGTLYIQGPQRMRDIVRILRNAVKGG